MTDFKFQPAAPIPCEELIAGGNSLSFVRPDGPSRCTWNSGNSSVASPHNFLSHEPRPEILPDILYAIGNTPLVKLNRIPQSYGIKCEILAKCEFLNPGGSVKDRIAYRMVIDAEKRGLLKSGSTIIEPSSGNTGIGLAMAAAVRGYRCIVVMPLKMSVEKVDTLRALGAEIIRTPTAAAFDAPEGLMAVAQQLCREIPNSIILDQYRNAFNPIAHYENTAQEILDQCGDKLDAIVCTAGTGGTIAGIGRRIKDSRPSCKIIAADPEGSILSLPEELNKTDTGFYEVEGIGYDFVPTVLDRSVVDKWYKTNDKQSLPLARRLIREEGLLCGGSSGSALYVALQVAKTLNGDQRLVVILPDGMRNYMTKFINDTWLAVRGLDEKENSELWWSKKPASVLNWKVPDVVPASMTYEDAIVRMREKSEDFLFVETDGKITGCVTSSKILALVSEAKITLTDPVSKVLDVVRQIDLDTPLKRVAAIIEKERFALLSSTSSGAVNGSGPSEYGKYTSAADLLTFISKTGN